MSVGESGNNDSNVKNSENEDEEQKLDQGPSVAAELKVDGNKERVKVNVTKIPLVSYAQKVSKSSNPSGMILNNDCRSYKVHNSSCVYLSSYDP